jgi:hypothetical protein
MGGELGEIAFNAYFGRPDHPGVSWYYADKEEKAWWRAVAQAVGAAIVGPGQVIIARDYAEALERLARADAMLVAIMRGTDALDPRDTAYAARIERDAALSAVIAHPDYQPTPPAESPA